MAPDPHALCCAALGGHALGITPRTPRTPAAFQSNALHDVRTRDGHYIAKVYLNPREWDDAPHREYLGLQLAEPHDIALRVIAMKAVHNAFDDTLAALPATRYFPDAAG
jgi:hypothetical protein